MELISSKKLRDFKESLVTTIEVNRHHVTPTDWHWIVSGLSVDAKTKSAWKKVPAEDTEYLEQLVRDGCSFAYASLLQSCSRNNVGWIHFSDSHELIRGLPLFTDAWAKPNPLSN